MFSDGFPEGQTRDINGEFPSDSHPYTEDYDYLSDSDLEDGSSCSEEEYAEAQENDDPGLPSSPRDSGSQVPLKTPLDHPPQPSADVRKAQNDERSVPISLNRPTFPDDLHSRPDDGSPRIGKVAIIRDMAAATYVMPAVNQSRSLTDL